MEIISFQIVLLAVAAMVAQWAGWRLHIPAIIFLLALGFLLGPMANLIRPDALMGDLLDPFIATAVAIILFEGSLQLRFKELREARRAVRQVIFLGAPIGWALISLAAHYIAGLEWPVAITLGGMLIVTGPTVIMPMLRQARLAPRVGAVLKWEGIVNDPVGILFAVLSYEYFVAAKEGHAGIAFFVENGVTLIGVVVVSFLLAHFIQRLFERSLMPEYLKTPFLLSVVLTLFFSCNIFLEESGLIAVTVLGVTLTNLRTAGLENIKRFKETISIMLVSGVFILLAARLDAATLLQLDWRAMLFVALLLFAIRPLTFAVCAIGTQMSRQEILLSGLIAPRGVVCTAMAGVIGPLLVEAGFADGDKVFPIAMSVVVISVCLHSLMIKPLARRLKLTSEETDGVIIAGAYRWSIQLAEALKAREVPVMMVDNNWSALSQARLADIPVYYGELLSEETEFTLEFTKYNTLIAATANPAYNALLQDEFGHEFGYERVFSVAPEDSERVVERRRISGTLQGRLFVSSKETLLNLIERFEHGWRFRIIRVGKAEEDGSLIVPEENESTILIGVIGKNGVVNFYSEDAASRPSPKEDELVIVMQREDGGPGET